MLLYNTDDNSTIMDGTPTGLYAAGHREVWRRDSHGNLSFRTWEKIVPRIDDSVLDCAIYLYSSEDDAREGIQFGGSGFLVGVPFGYDDPDWSAGDSRGPQSLGLHHLYAVTNKHVAVSLIDCYPIARLNTKDGNTLPIDLFGHWKFLPTGDDLAVAAIDLDKEVFKYKFVSILTSPFVTKEVLERVALGPGDETFMVSRFIGRDERQSNMPIVRFGHISGSQAEMIRQDEKNNCFPQESFLVECHSVSGSSGSPVFVWVPADRAFKATYHSNPTSEQRMRSALRQSHSAPREFFFGVDWGHLDEANPAGMAGVVPAWKLLELLKIPEFVEMRQVKEKQIARLPHGHSDVASRPKIQRTTPKEGDGVEIPIPTEGQFFGDLAKIMRRKPPQSES